MRGRLTTTLDTSGARPREASSTETEEANRRLGKEFIRRMALWADKLQCRDEWPFFDVAAKLEPTLFLPEGAEERLTRALREAPVGGLMKRLLRDACRWAHLVDVHPQRLHDLPDPYQPLLGLLENGGEIHYENGTVLVPIVGFRLLGLDHYLSRSPYISDERSSRGDAC